MKLKPIARIIYAIPPEHLHQENGTSHRLDSLRNCLEEHFDIAETNLLDPPLSRSERMKMLAIGLLGMSNNLRYLALSHRIPKPENDQLTILKGNYCACLALLPTQKPLILDLVDSLTLTDLRGIQSLWGWRPLIYLAQLPSSWLIEHLLKRQPYVQAILITTNREKRWLEKLHGSWAKVHVMPNQVHPRIRDVKKTLVISHEVLNLAFIGSLSWWVNQVAAQKAVCILDKFLKTGQSGDREIILNVYGTDSIHIKKLLKKRCEGLKIVNHGYVENLNCIADNNHAAFLPNPIGRGFQNKMFSCLALGMPTIAHISMNPDNPKDVSRSPVIYCRKQKEYEEALIKVWTLTEEDRKRIAKESLDYIVNNCSSLAIEGKINDALNQILP